MFGPQPGDPRIVFVAEPGKTAHPSDSWRVGRPSYELKERGYRSMLAVPEIINSVPKMAAHLPEIIVLPRMTPFAGQFGPYVEAMHAIGSAVVLDWDDSPDWHPQFRTLNKNYKQIVKDAWDCLKLADGITATTPDLCDHIRERTDKPVHWTPNLIPTTPWTNLNPKGRPKEVTIGVMGGDSHGTDWELLRPVWLRIARHFPDVHFVCAGWQPTWMRRELPKDRYHFLEWGSYYQYPHNAAWIDIGCAPLVDTTFNRCKSPIKWMEYSLAGAATVVSPIMYGVWCRQNETALIAETADEWYDALAALVQDSSLRSRLSLAARQEVFEWHTFTDERCRVWMDQYRSIYRGVFGHDSTSDGAQDSGVGASNGSGPSAAVLRGITEQLRRDAVPQFGDTRTAGDYLRHAERLPAGLTSLRDYSANGDILHSSRSRLRDKREILSAPSRLADVLSVRGTIDGHARFRTDH